MKPNDKKILELQRQIQVKKGLIEDAKFHPTTNCSLTVDGTRYNLHALNDKGTICVLIGKLNAIRLGLIDILPEESVTLDGYTIDQWLTDLRAKFNSVNTETEKKRLKALELKLHELLSTDTKIDMEIESLKNQI